jgi:hypothetical protein
MFINKLKILKMSVVAFGLLGAGLSMWLVNGGIKAEAADMVVYKSPSCGCCGAWVDHIRDNGITVDVVERDDLSSIKAQMGVPERMESCHTARIDGYTIEGHVPATDIKRLLSERPDARGLSVPGMPIGSPGMEMGDEKDPYAVVLFGDQGYKVFARHN